MAGSSAVECILLGQKIAAEQSKTARHLKERFDLLPPDIERFNFLFNTALSSNGLSTETEGRLTGNMPAPTATAAPVMGNALAGEARAAGNGLPSSQPDARRSLLRAKTVAKTEQAREKLAAADATDGDDASLNGLVDEAKKDMDRRDQARQLYHTQDKTMEYVENNYYHLPIETQVADLIKVNAFWKDFAEQNPTIPFLTKNLAEPASHFTEIMFALSVLDLPFEEPKHTIAVDGGTATLTAGGPLIAFHKELKEAAPAAEKTPILVSQNYYRASDRYTFVDNERTDKYVADEFLTHVVYGCQVVITNPTSSRQKLDALLQLPKGAMPVSNARYTNGLHLDLQPYETKAIEYFFYFPATADFAHYPVQVAKNEKLVASVAPSTLKVVTAPTKIDTTSWDHISQNSKPEEVLEFLKNNNIDRLNLEKIAWRMQDKDFFTQTLALLRDRHVYNNTLWSYSLKHNDAANAREFLQHQDNFIAQCGDYLDSPLLTINPVARYAYQHMEYMPLVNARAHRLGRQRQILNDRFYQQYERTLSVLRYHPALTDEDLMAVTYYLLLQDRIDDGLKSFQRITRDKIEEKLQYDYLAAYTAFYGDHPGSARAIADPYKNYPVDRWKNLFTNVLAQVDEIEGKTAAVVDKLDRNQQQNVLAATEPTFEFKVDAKQILLTYKNVPEVKINYYLMDIELMFSQNPFLQEYGTGGGQFAMIKPNDSAILKLDPAKPNVAIPLPEKFLTQNVMVEIVAAGKTQSQAYYANSLAVQLTENYGQLRVTSEKSAQPLAKVYVKVYARTKDNQTIFYKDGYTDLRGKFDYTSLNTNELDNVEKFSLLILSDTHGAHCPHRLPAQTLTRAEFTLQRAPPKNR